MILLYILLVFMILIWSFSFILVDISVEIIPPLSIALYRFIVASISFMVVDFYLFLRKIVNKKQISLYKTDTKYNKIEIVYIILASFLGISLFFYAQYNAIQLIGPSLPALFVCLLSPVLITLLSLIFFKEKLTKLKITGFIVATIGGFFLITGGNFAVLTPTSPNFVGYAYALITPAFWAIYTILMKKISRDKSRYQILKYLAYLGTIELFLFVVLRGELQIFLTNFLNIILLLVALYLGIGCYVVGYYIWNTSQNKLVASKVSSFLYIEPFITLIFSFLFQRKENVLLLNIMGGIIVLVAVLIINYEKI